MLLGIVDQHWNYCCSFDIFIAEC